MILSSDTIDNSLFTLDFVSHMTLSLTFTSNWLPVAVAETELDIDCRVRPTTNYTSIMFHEFKITDGFTVNPLHCNLLQFPSPDDISSPQNGTVMDTHDLSSSPKHPIEFCYQKIDNSSAKLSLTVQPILVNFNILCAYAFSDIFKVKYLELTWGSALDDFKRLLNVYDISNTDKTLEVAISLKSLVVIVPADSSVDVGYIRVNAGEMMLTGKETSNNTIETRDDLASGYISFQNFGVDFLCPSQMNLQERERHSIIKPFNFLVLFETAEDSGENFIVNISISPKLDILYGLLHSPIIMRIIDLLTYSEVKNSGNKRARTISKVANILTNVTESSSKAVTEALTKIHSKIKWHPSSCFLKCTALIPSLMVTIVYDSQNEHEFKFDIEQLSCEVEVKLFDFKVCIDVDNISLQDSFRRENEKFLLSTNMESSSSEGGTEKFLHIVYDQYLHTKSPMYSDYAAGVHVAVGKMNSSIDSTVFGRLGAVIDAFSNREDVSHMIIDTQIERSRSRTLSCVDDTVYIPAVPSTAPEIGGSGPSGVNLFIKISEISIMLNRDCSALASEQTCAPGRVLESTILCCMEDVVSDVKIRVKEYIVADFHIASIGISDRRDITRDFCYNNILFPFGDSDHVGLFKEGCPRDERSLDLSSTMSCAMDGKKAYHLSVSYVQENAHSQNIEFMVRSLSVFLSFDIILEAISVISEHVVAVRKMRQSKLPTSSTKANNPHAVDTNSTSDSFRSSSSCPLVEEAQQEDGKISDSLCVRIFIPSPQFIFLENPTEPNSEAVVCRSRIDINFRRDITASTDPETLQSVHLSLSDLEFFVLLDMTQWHPHQLVQPVTSEFHFSTAVTRSVMTQATMSLHVGQVNANFSLNDLILLQSIWMRRGLVSEIVQIQKATSSKSPDFSLVDKDGSSSHVVYHNFFVNLEKMDVTVVNDFDGCFIPLLNFNLDQTSCKVEGFRQDLHGSGALVCGVNYYDASIREWEPILEAWYPEFILSSTSDNTSVSLTSQNHVQFNITSVFLDMSLQTLSLLHTFRNGTERELPPAIKFENKLGQPVTLLDGQTKKMLFHLKHNAVANVFIGQVTSGYHFMSNEKSLLNVVLPVPPDSIDLYFDDEAEDGNEVISPLVQLPLHVINTTNIYPMNLIASTSTSQNDSSNADKNVVKEEIYEYQRYNPLSLSWIDPFLSNDPHRWSDATGVAQKIGKNSVQLPLERGWKWIEDWKIDVSAKLGVQIDAEGFHYGFDFYAICGKSDDMTLRTFRPLDCVRRRRWVRRRSLKTKSDDAHLFWDVRLEKNGSKVVTIRSALQIRNSLPYDVSAHLDNGEVIGPIPEDCTFSVPLKEANGVNFLALKPSFLPSSLSTEISCADRPSDFMSIHNVQCVMKSDEKSYLSLNALVRQRDKSIHVSVFPHALIFNALPCSVKFKFTNSVGDVVDQDYLDTGESRKLCFLSLKENNFVSLQLSSSAWSPVQSLNRQRDSNLTIPLYSCGKLILKIYMKVSYLNTNTSKIEIFTKCAFVDYSRLNIVLSSAIDESLQMSVVRSTYTTADCLWSSLFEAPQDIEIPKSNDCVDITNLTVRSRRKYCVISGISVDDLVHTDRDLHFLFIPKLFQNQTYISTACDDRTVLIDDRVTNSFINFSVSVKVMVFIMIDRRASVPFWMKKSKFVKVLDQAVAHGVYNGYKQEVYYSLFGKVCDPGVVHLGSNFSKDAKGMYGIFVIPAQEDNGSSKYLLNQLNAECIDMNETSSDNWCSGGKGITLFNTDDDNKILLGVQEDGIVLDAPPVRSWSQSEVDLTKTITATKIPFEVVNEITDMAYQLVYKIESLPGVFHRMKILEVMPRYLIVNATDEPLYLRQDRGASGVSFKADDVFDIQPYCTKGWHKRKITCSTSLQVRFPTTSWSSGAFDINEIGSSEILLPRTHTRTLNCHTVVNVEVKLGTEEDKCSVCILFWKSADASKSPMSVSNNSSFMISIRQGNEISSEGDMEVNIPPKKNVPFGWANPCFDAPRTISISIGDSVDSEVGTTATVNVLELSKQTNLFLVQSATVPVATVTIELQSTGRIIKINDYSNVGDIDEGTVDVEIRRTLSINLGMQSIGLSLIASLPSKRELVCFHIEDFFLSQTHLVSASTVELTIGNVQIDNYSETAVYPVLFRRHGDSSANSDANGVNSPFIQAAFLKESVNGTHKVTYFSLRVLKFVIELDSGSIYILLSDLFSGIDFVSSDKLMAFSHPVAWMSNFNRKLLSIGERYELTDIERLIQNSHQSRTLFENIIIHPTQCFLTFVHTERPMRDDVIYSSSSYVDLLASIGAVDLMAIRLNSFIVSNAIESFDSLQARIWAKFKRDVKMQLAQIAGSLTILGSPVGLVRNVGGGVKSFFYEPAVGLVQSPLSFILGLHKGTSGLVSGVLSGTLNTTAALVGTASSGISFLSGDREYMQDRSLKMKKRQAARGGAISGFVDGGVAAFTGIASGVTGVILRPMEGAQREGTVGFLKGVGKGIAGVAVKPVLGVTDGVTSIVQGISNEVGKSYGHHHIRPPRAFKRISTNPKARLLSFFDLNDAYAQLCVVKHSERIGLDDEFISQMTLGPNSQIIFSDKCVWWMHASRSDVYLWDDISYVLQKPGQLEINRSVGSSKPVYINISDAFVSKVYSTFLTFSSKMTNPSVMRNAMYREQAQRPSSRAKSKSHSFTIREALQCMSYEFGSHNYDEFPFIKMKEGDLVVQTRAKLLMAPSRVEIHNESNGDTSCDITCPGGDTESKDRDTLFEYVDITTSWLIRQWDLNHSIEGNGRTVSYCCVALVVNNSPCPVEVINTEIVSGRTLWSLGSEGTYCAVRCGGDDDEEREKIIPIGGYVLLLVCGNEPSFFHSGNVELLVQTSAFDILVTNNDEKTAFVVKKNPFETEFVEKTTTDSWSKHVLVIT